MGDAIVADVRSRSSALLDALGDGRSSARPRRRGRDPSRRRSPTRSARRPSTRRSPRCSPTDGDRRARVAVLARSRCATGCASRSPGSYFFGAGGGLGFGLAAAVGVQLAQPDRPVVCVLGEGSAQYAITALWTAVAYEVPVTFLVLRNDEYAILKWFAGLEEVEGAPGLDLPALDTAALAAGYGVDARSVDGREELRAALGDGARLGGAGSCRGRVAPGMALA